MKHLLLSIFMMSALTIVAQSGLSSFSVKVSDCNKSLITGQDELLEIEADFRVSTIYGSAPLTVEFDDRSTGNPVRWSWLFGDGTIDTVPNPVHVYNQEGIYTVKLTVWDADSILSTDSRADFIRVVGYGICDSVNYDIPGNYYLYRLESPNTGFLSGNNSNGDLAKASYFYINEDKGMLMGGMFFFALKTNGLTTDPDIVFNAWEDDGEGGTPGTVLDSYSMPLSNIAIDEQGTGFYPATLAFFDSWVPIDDDFFMGFELPQTEGDTLAVYTNKLGSTTSGNGWEQTASGVWQPYEVANPDYNLDNAIFPIICQPTGIDNHILQQNLIIYPIPAKDRIYINFFDQNIQKATVSLYDLAGRMVAPSQEFFTGSSIDVSNLSEGLYLLQIESNQGITTHKVMVE